MKTTITTFIFATAMRLVMGQSLPHHWMVDEPNHRIRIGENVESGIFNVDVIDTIYLEFANSNWFNTMVTNFINGTELPATLTYQGVSYQQVGVSFKGQTSYSMVNGEEKKSFNIRMDSAIPGQDLDGYDVLNLNNCFEDPSFLREFIYLYLIRHEVPAASAAFVELVVNNVPWGIYPLVQQLDGEFIREWYPNPTGSRWRADAPAGSGGPGGPGWGDGTAALNYLGAAETLYQSKYTLKGSTESAPWTDLIHTCDVLNNTNATDMTTAIPAVLDLDRTLWFLACENIFGDDDSYIFKGKMDYYLFWDAETGRMTPLEFDGNSVLVTESVNWGVFYHADNVNYPLLNKLLVVPEFRQRYLAHYRTIISEIVDPALAGGLIQQFGSVIDPHVQADTKKLYTYAQFTSDVTALNSKLQTRRNLVMSNTELNTVGATIGNVALHTVAGVWLTPVANEEVSVTASIDTPDGIDHITLYYSDALTGNFSQTLMVDDGNNSDGSAGDGVFGGSIPGMPVGTVIRFYLEAVEANSAKTVSYNPIGAEHDVYYYNVLNAWAPSTDVVINEMMAKNTNTAADELSEYEDWIEIYNRGTEAVDLTNYYITDNSWNPSKWRFPDATILNADSYLILWADEDSTDGVYHTNFKLSTSGETITLINALSEIADQTVFGTQQSDLGYARIPNGTGNFVMQSPTFSAYNSMTIGIAESNEQSEVSVFPNPANEVVHFKSKWRIQSIALYDLQGKCIMSAFNQQSLNLSQISSGLYMLKLMDEKNNVSDFRIVKQ